MKCEPGCIHERELEAHKAEERRKGRPEWALAILDPHPWELSAEELAEVRRQCHALGATVPQP